MGKSHAPEVDNDALAEYRLTRDLTLEALRNRFLQFEERRQAQELGTPHIAFEALSSLLGGQMQGYSDDELRSCWPEAWGEATVSVPASLLDALTYYWARYREDTAGRTIGEVFGLEGGGQGRQRSITAQNKSDLHRGYANAVLRLYTRTGDENDHLTLTKAIEQVAEDMGVSHETVEAAYKAYGRAVIESGKTEGFLKGGKSS